MILSNASFHSAGRVDAVGAVTWPSHVCITPVAPAIKRDQNSISGRESSESYRVLPPKLLPGMPKPLPPLPKIWQMNLVRQKKKNAFTQKRGEKQEVHRRVRKKRGKEGGGRQINTLYDRVERRNNNEPSTFLFWPGSSIHAKSLHTWRDNTTPFLYTAASVRLYVVSATFSFGKIGKRLVTSFWGEHNATSEICRLH